LTKQYKSVGEALYHLSSPTILQFITKDEKVSKTIFRLIQQLKRQQIENGTITEEKKKELDRDLLKLYDEVFENKVPDSYVVLDFSSDTQLMHDILEETEPMSISSPTSSTTSTTSETNFSNSSSLGLSTQLETQYMATMEEKVPTTTYKPFTSKMQSPPMSSPTSVVSKTRNRTIFYNVPVFSSDLLTDAEKIAISNCGMKLEKALKNHKPQLLELTCQNLCLPDRFKYRFFHPYQKQDGPMRPSKKRVSLPLKLVITALAETQMHRIIRRIGHVTNVVNSDDLGGFGMFHTSIIMGNWLLGKLIAIVFLIIRKQNGMTIQWLVYDRCLQVRPFLFAISSPSLKQKSILSSIRYQNYVACGMPTNFMM